MIFLYGVTVGSQVAASAKPFQQPGFWSRWAYISKPYNMDTGKNHWKLLPCYSPNLVKFRRKENMILTNLMTPLISVNGKCQSKANIASCHAFPPWLKMVRRANTHTPPTSFEEHMNWLPKHLWRSIATDTRHWYDT